MLLAAAIDSAAGLDPLSILNTAADVAFLILFITGRIVTGKAGSDERDRAERAEKALADLNALMIKEVIPQIALCADALKQVTPFLQAEIAIRTARNADPTFRGS